MILKPKHMKRFNKFIDTQGECWTWQGNTIDGYGRFKIDDVRYMAHRLSYQAYYGPISDEQPVLHRCNNTNCVRPEHLYLGTFSDNAIDRVKAGRHNFAKLTTTEVHYLKGALRLLRLPQYKLAKLFSISEAVVSEIKHGKLWAWIE